MKRRNLIQCALVVAVCALAFSVELQNALATSFQGPNYGSAATNSSVYGEVAWANPSNGLTSDGTYATAPLSTNIATYLLSVSGFGFAIPTGSTLDGIVVNVQCGVQPFILSTSNGAKSWAKLMYNGGGITLFKTAYAAGLGTECVQDSTLNLWDTFGSPTDLWGYSWVVGEINSVGFGVGFGIVSDSVANHNVGENAYVDAVQVTVYYESPTTTTSSSTSSATYVSSVTVTSTVSTFGVTVTSAIGLIDNPNFIGNTMVVGVLLVAIPLVGLFLAGVLGLAALEIIMAVLSYEMVGLPWFIVGADIFFVLVVLLLYSDSRSVLSGSELS